MTDPKQMFLTDLHAYQWPDGVEVQLERFKEGSESFSALVTVMRVEGEGPRLLLPQARMNFHAPQTVSSNAKALASAYPAVSQAEWMERLKHVGYQSWAQYQEGGSILRHADEIDVDYELPSSLMHPLIAGSGVTLFYADSSAGKTMFAEAVGLSIVTGLPILGITPTLDYSPTEEQPGGRTYPVIYYDWEDNEETFRERVGALCAGNGIDVPHDFIYRAPDRSVIAGEARIRRECEENGVALAIFDSVGEMLGGDPSDPTLVIPAVNVMKRIGCPALALHHLNAEQAKSKDLRDKQKGYGNIYIRSGARLQWFLDRFQEEEADVGYLYAHNTKVNRGKKSNPLSWMVEYENGANEHLARLRYSTRSAGDYFDRLKQETPAQDLSVKDAIVRALESQHGFAFDYPSLTALVNKLRGRTTTEGTVTTKAGELVKENVLVKVVGEDKKVRIALRSDRNDW